MQRELLHSITKKDFKITWFSGSGAGGQHRNKHQNCVRLNHLDSNVTVTGQSHRERSSNLKEAFHNLLNNGNFKAWHNRKINEILNGKTLEEEVNEMIKSKNLKIEGKDEDNKWVDL